jgi:hypothetical protein
MQRSSQKLKNTSQLKSYPQEIRGAQHVYLHIEQSVGQGSLIGMPHDYRIIIIIIISTAMQPSTCGGPQGLPLGVPCVR